MLRVITQRRLARIVGIGEMSISKHAKTNLESARVKRGNRFIGLDVDNILFKEWLAKYDVFEIDSKYCRIIKTQEEQEADRKNGETTPKVMVEDVPENRINIDPEIKQPEINNGRSNIQTHIGGYPIEALADLTVREVVMRYGSVEGFKRFVDSLKTIADYNFRELKIKEKRGELVSRKLISNAVFQLLDLSFQRLVTDVPSNISQQVLAIVETGGDNVVNDIENIYRQSTSSILKNIKAAIIKTNTLVESNK